MPEYNFQKELEKSVLNADEKLNKKELLTDIFKAYIAKCLEHVSTRLSSNSQGRIQSASLDEIKSNLIREFRAAQLGEYQKSVEQYEYLFGKAIKEIMELASHNHGGIDIMSHGNSQLIYNPNPMQKGAILS